jgi:hypothetical protein
MKKSILIVDDHLFVRTILGDNFTSELADLDVYEACDGIEAIKKSPRSSRI